MQLAITLLLQAIWTGPTGGGMLGVQEPAVVPPGHGAVGVVLDNYDRDPLGLDIDEVRTSLRVGVGHRMELYGSWYFSRAVTIPGAHPVPPPPLDVIVASDPRPQGPYRATYWPLPYVAGRSSSVGDFIPGDVILGIKRQLTGHRGWRPALSLSGHLLLPLSQNLRNLHRGSGPGSVDIGLHASAGWYVGPWTMAGNLGFTHSGQLRYDDRFITGTTIEPTDVRRPDFLRTTAGLRYRVDRHASLMAEVFHVRSVGNHTATEDSVGASDVLIGIQLDARRFTLTAGYRQHLWPPRTAMVRPTGPLAGAVILTNLDEHQRRDALASLGMPMTGLRPDAALIVTGIPSDAALPPGAERIPATYTTSTTGNSGAVLLLAVRF